MENNAYVQELKKFIKQDVKVVAADGTVFEGQCRAINFTHLNIVLIVGDEKVIVKNVKSISRVRDYKGNNDESE